MASSSQAPRTQNTSQEAYPIEEAVQPQGAMGRAECKTGTNQEETHAIGDVGTLERILSRENLTAALKRVRANRGAPGIDGMTTHDLAAYLQTEWIRIKGALLAGTYRPQPVRRVEIPKPGGGKRMLGIPTVLDRFIQQAIAQELTLIFDPQFSTKSFGFRPGLRAHDAVKQVQTYIQEGYTWVVDMDLEKFFDRVNHDVLMAKVARKVGDKRVLRLIRRYLESGIMVNGVCIRSEEGTPQGGPLSPLLANVLLDDLDKELERRGHRFARYADDCNILVKSERSGRRVMESITSFLEGYLRLKVNREKSAVDRPWNRKFLGFSFYYHQGEIRIRLAPKTIARLKGRIREMTSRTAPLSLEERLTRLNTYLKGWVTYFALADAGKRLSAIDQWTRRRLRMCQWKQWKKSSARKRNLRALGLPEEQIAMVLSSRKGCWRIANTPQLDRAMGLSYWKQRGLVSLADRHHAMRHVS
jgi:group II intron reverse transcriptase/maturase